ncbi:MAG: hypothetical protein HKN19_03905 [Halioglobus sp.]|nr:hypothetical protein [Halioglobus sp.]
MSSDERVVFFVHVMKTGGSTALRQLRRTYPEAVRYPLPGAFGVMEEKSLVTSLMNVDAERRERLRWIAPHVPLSVALDYRASAGRPVAITLVLRDGYSRALSHLRQVSRRFEHRYTYRELLDLPFIGDFFLSNHQTRVLGSGPDFWPVWDDCMRALVELPRGFEEPGATPRVNPVDGSELDRAVANLGAVDVLGLQDEFGTWWQACRAAFDWPEAPQGSVNVGSDQETTPPPVIPDAILDELRERNALDSRLYTAARELLAARA